MKNLCCTFLLLISLFFSACETEKFDPLADNGNPTSYALKSIRFTISSTEIDAYLFTYNDNYRLSEIRRITSTFYSLDDSSGAFRDTLYNKFTYYGKNYVKLESYRSQDPGNGSYWIYEYDSQHKVKKQIFYDNKNVEVWRKSYEYENNNVAKEISSKGKDVFSICTMDYNVDNNLTAMTYYDLSTPQKKSKREYLSFDNHVNYTKAINGSPIIFSWSSYIMPGYSGSSPNNYIDCNTYSPINIDQPFDKAIYSSISTEKYNDEGLPLIQKSGDLTITYEYEKYR